MISFQSMQLNLLDARIGHLSNQVESYKDAYLQTEALKENIKEDLDATLSQRNDLEDQYQSKTDAISGEQQKISSENQTLTEIQDKIVRAQQEVDHARQVKEQKEGWLATIQNQMEGCKQSINQLRQEMQAYEQIINSPAPKPQYKTEVDGLYCINNIYMCKNHPPRELKVLLNGNEIEAYKQTVEKAKFARDDLARQRDAYSDQYQQLYQQYISVESEVNIAAQNYQECLQILSDLKQQEQENRQSKQKDEQDLDGLQSGVSQISQELSALRNRAYNLQGDLTRAQYAADQANAVWMGAQAQLQALNNQRQNLQESINRAKDELLMQMALQDLQEEQQTSYLQNLGQELRNQINGVYQEGHHLADRVKEFGRDVRGIASDVITTAADIIPSAASLQTKVIGQQIDEIVGNPRDPHTGDLFIDLGRRPASNQ